MKNTLRLASILVLALSFCSFALATNPPSNTDSHDCQGNSCNTTTVNNTTNNTDNSLHSASTSGAVSGSSLVDNSKTTNTNTALGGQGGSVKDSGNSASFSGASATGGAVKDSGNSESSSSVRDSGNSSVKNSGNSSNENLNLSSNKNSNKQGQAQGQDQGQEQSATAVNEGNNTSITTNVAAPKIPVNSAYAPNAFPTANCAMAYSGAGQGMLAGAAGAFTRIDKTCQQIETARSFALYDARAAYCKVMISTKWAKKAKVTLEDCMTKEAVPAPTPAAAVQPEVKTPVAAIVNPYPSR
jgi:hypothetical protein